MKKMARLGVASVLIVSGMARIELVAQETPAREAKGAAERGKVNHLVFPVKTDLQRFLLGRDDQVFVAINLAGMVGDGKVDADALKAIATDLARYPAKETTVRFHVLHVNDGKPGHGFDAAVLNLELRKLANDLGLGGEWFVEEYVNGRETWQSRISSLAKEVPGQAGGDESGLDDRAVKVYPVRTPLSRYLTGDADCVVEILMPTAAEFDAEIEPAIARAITRLKVGRKEKISFRVLVSGKFEGAGGRISDQTAILAKSLGFPKSSVTVSAAPSPPQ
jgi:hypothetical protein